MKSPIPPAAYGLQNSLRDCAGVGYVGSASGDDQPFLFADEGASGDGLGQQRLQWKVLVVDDDHSVHQVTTLALANEKVHGRELALLHAYSAAEARLMLAGDDAIDLLLLDIVMETHDAGLQLAKEIRYDLGRSDLKIIVRTGQPGFERDEVVRMAPEIDGYINKAGLSLATLLEAIATLLPRE